MKGSRGPWRPVIVWAAVILIATSAPVSDLTMRAPVPWLDKVIHATLYGVLGWLVGTTLRASGRRRWHAFVAGLLGIAAFAAVDEAHQALLPGRATSVLDWMADLFGAIAGLSGGAILGAGTTGGDGDGGQSDNRGGLPE